MNSQRNITTMDPNNPRSSLASFAQLFYFSFNAFVRGRSCCREAFSTSKRINVRAKPPFPPSVPLPPKKILLVKHAYSLFLWVNSVWDVQSLKAISIFYERLSRWSCYVRQCSALFLLAINKIATSFNFSFAGLKAQDLLTRDDQLIWA